MAALNNPVSLQLLRSQLKEALQLDLDEFGLEDHDREGYSSQFIGINFQSAFQPIYDIQAGDLYGHEALLRPNLANIKEASPEFAFTYADASGKLVKLDRISRTLHVLNYNQIFGEKGLLFLNVHPHLLISVSEHGKVFERILHTHAVPTHRVVIEIRDYNLFSQHENLQTYETQLAEAIENYHERGYKIAIDNFGNQHSIANRLWKLKPDFVKFDQHLIQTVENQPRLQKALHGLVELIRDLDATPIVTGIETQRQLDFATAAGAHLLQGYLLGKPLPAKALQASPIVQRQFHQTAESVNR